MGHVLLRLGEPIADERDEAGARALLVVHDDVAPAMEGPSPSDAGLPVARITPELARALVGFDVRDGRSVPRFDGVVVCDEYAPLLIEGAATVQQHAEDKQVRKQRADLLAHWRALLRALSIRERLEQQYGSA